MHRLGITCALVLVSLSLLSAETAQGGAAETSFIPLVQRPDGGQTDAGQPGEAGADAAGLRLPEPALPVKVADAHTEQALSDLAPAVQATMVRETTAGGLALPALPFPEPANTAPDGAAAAGGGNATGAGDASPAAGARPVAYSYTHRDAPQLDPGSAEPAGLSVPGQPVAPATVEPPPAPPPAAETLELALLWPEAARRSGGILAERQVIAYYGHPYSRLMGVLGESPIEEMTAKLLARAAEYDEINGEIGVAPAFHIIYGTVYEDASIGILRESKLLEYIRFAADNDIIVFLDHQIGRYTVREAIEAMLPYLAYENVHLAIDPEWATTQPGKVIGGVRAEEINQAQQMMSDYMRRHGIAGPKMLVVHQFNWRMITDRETVRSDYDGVQLIHNADGFGRPAEKYVSWEFNVRAANMPLKGFKLFYPKSWRDGGYDEPLLSPREVLQLEPVPVYIQYQ